MRDVEKYFRFLFRFNRIFRKQNSVEPDMKIRFFRVLSGSALFAFVKDMITKCFTDLKLCRKSPEHLCSSPESRSNQ